MKWILISIGAFVLIVAIVLLILWRILRHNIKDKGGMENSYYTRKSTFVSKEGNTSNK